MKRLLIALLLLAPMVSAQEYNVGFRPRTAGGGSGVSWTDGFTRTPSDTSNIVATCSSEGPGGDCGWVEVTGDLSIISNELASTSSGAYKVVANLDTDTLAQYAGATSPDSPSSRKSGPVVRGTAAASASDCWYTFEIRDSTSFRIRACQSADDCDTVETFTNGGGDFTNMAQTDALGISVNSETGDNVQFTVYKFDTADAPAMFSSWADVATATYSVCDTTDDCDRVWDMAPSDAKCTADNKRVGLSLTSANAAGWDNWRGGDT